MPNAAADAEEPAIVEIDVGFAFDDVDTKMGVVPKFRTGLVLVAVPVCRSMRRRAWLMDYDGPAMVRRQDNPVAAPDRDDNYQCGKKLCETKHGRYLQ